MRLAFLIAPVMILGAAACADPIARPQGPAGPLDGAWTTGMVPSGAYVELSLATDGPRVSGTGRQQFGLSNGRLVTYTVTGQQSIGAFTLTLASDSGSVATYTGTLADPNTLTGTWTTAGSSWTRSFLRQGP